MDTLLLVCLILLGITILAMLAVLVSQLIAWKALSGLVRGQDSQNDLAYKLATESMDRLLAALNQTAFYDIQNAKLPHKPSEPEDVIVRKI